MTRTEFCEKYGDAKVIFHSYYKYSFSFEGQLPDGKTIHVCVGGNSDEIYRMDVLAGCEETVSSLDPYSGTVMDGKTVVDEFYDY